MWAVAFFACILDARAQTTWTIDSLAQVVQPMCHRLDGRFPVIAWTVPEIAFKDQAAADYLSGELNQRIATLWERGVVPAIMLDDAPWGTAQGQIAVARAAQDNGAPVHAVAMLPGGPREFWPESSWFTVDGKTWPLLPEADPEPAYYHVYDKLLALRDAGITVNALWQDYEDLPNPWNGVYPAQNWYVNNVDSLAYRGRGIDWDIPGDWTKFKKYAYDLRFPLLRQSSMRALVELFGAETTYGNYGDFRSSLASPAYDLNGISYPPSSVGADSVAMPAVYANNRRLPAFLASAGELTPERVDDIHWFLMMRVFSATAANDPPGALTIPFVSPEVNDLNDPLVNGTRMSEPIYRELLRHLWLRGADGMVAFTTDPTRYPMYTAESELAKIESVRAVLDEMLGYRDFLVHGVPMNFAFDSAVNYSPRTVWSGLARTYDAIVHLTSLNGSTDPVTIQAFGETFTLTPVPSAGVTYYIHKGHRIRRVGPP